MKTSELLSSEEELYLWKEKTKGLILFTIYLVAGISLFLSGVAVGGYVFYFGAIALFILLGTADRQVPDFSNRARQNILLNRTKKGEW